MSAQVQAQQQHYSPEDYLDLEEAAEYKSEYHDGEIFIMAGGTINHNQISLNLCTAMRSVVKKQGFRVFMADVRLWIPYVRSYLYPDVMVIGSPPAYFQNRKDTVTNPQMIIEVLSKSTQDYDRGEKFKYYRTLPSFSEYVLVSQSDVYVEQFSKTPDNHWLWRTYEADEETLELKSFPFEMSLKDIYEQVDFEGS
ncbi:MAG: Uma2 family endonuclease [Candidatus Parabeggiatoa sp. nov. 3]|nr:MAG: Uma2 family endonuclease [Gammaproteobacteria bacterium]RKZ61871.1 MAG: Uma2 family endonuclease [Gammaproteobacteria bacterium]RKZ83272.1 MAG: Uma2 family endonuclease [Gammaproteobacteria bacterium]